MQHAISETPMSTNQDPEAAVLPAPETETVTSWKVACSGNEALGLGHPRVWLRIAPETGKALELINYVSTGYGVAAGMVADYAKQVGLKIIPKEEERSIHYQRMLANELELSMWGMDGAIYPVWLNYAWWISPVWQQGSSRLGPAYGLWRTSGGKEGIEPTGDCMKMYELLEAAWLETDGAKRIELCKQMLDIASENCWTVSLGQITDSLMLVKNNFGNVPDQAISDWVFRTEKNTHPEQYYFKS